MKRLLMVFWRISRRDLRFACFALRHPSGPGWLVPVAVVMGLYALSPLNFALPVPGIVDDVVMLPLALHWIVKLLPATLRSELEHQAGSPARSSSAPSA